MVGPETLVGFLAASCTALANLPQVIKAWKTHSTGDLSLKMILLLGAGLALWVVYGMMRGDMVIILANLLSLALVANLLVFKLKELRSAGGVARQAR
jgi:MtN3 and saliva related transmembrane protein